MTDREMGIEEARKSLGDLVLDAQRDNIATRITRKGKPAAILVSDARYSIVLAIYAGVRAVTHAANGKRLSDETTLTVGDLHSAIGEAAIEGLEKS